MSDYPDQAAAVADALAGLDVHPDDRILIMSPNGPDFAAAFADVIQRRSTTTSQSTATSARRHGSRRRGRCPAGASPGGSNCCADRPGRQATGAGQWAPGILDSPTATPLSTQFTMAATAAVEH
jgi:hypothetical protein